MSFINNLIRQAKQGATVLRIRPNQIGAVANHMWAVQFSHVSLEHVRAAIINGDTRLLDVPVKVIGTE